MNGVINIYKEKGYTSHDVVAKLRGILKQKKIGHTGTLDPDAEGVLPVCLGNATKLCDILTDKNKTYEAVLLLGVETDTEDTSGTIINQRKVTVSNEEVEKVIYSFIGTYNQIPPMYSALKVNGKKLYELAREGIVIERKPREVEIFHIEILEINLPRVRFTVSCSKGTYIRTLCKDIGEALGCGGCMEQLLRRKVSVFTLENAYTLSQVEQLKKEDNIGTIITSVPDLFPNYKKIVMKEDYNRFLYNGNPFFPFNTQSSQIIGQEDVLVYDSNQVFLGIYRWDEKKKQYAPVKMFLEGR